MPRSHWLVKSEPSTYSWEQLQGDGSTCWDGVRNAQARNFLRGMKRGDLVLFYHSGKGKEIVGVAKVTRESYPDPTTDDERWLAVDLAPLRPLKTPVTLQDVKSDAALRAMALVRQSRLSVMPVEPKAFERILKRGATSLPRRV